MATVSQARIVEVMGPHILQKDERGFYEDVTGRLVSLHSEDEEMGIGAANIEIMPFKIRTIIFPLKIWPRLLPMVGKLVCLWRIGDDYLVREVTE